jgi:phosphoglycerate kinase
VAIVGGAKVADKLGIMKVLVARADTVIVGGGMAFTFEVASGRTIGSSLFDPKYVDQCGELLKSGRVLLPSDTRGLPDGAAFGVGGGTDDVVDFGASIPDGFEGLDIGCDSAQRFADVIASAASILWNGPMGVFEDAPCR